MPESEFEKQVQEELGQLRLRPSEEVWQNVEKELRKKKRIRIVFLIFLLAGLALLSYPGYQFFKQSPNDLAHTSEEQRANTKPDKTNHSNINDIRSS